MSDIIFFSSRIIPETGEVVLQQVETERLDNPALLIVYDPTNADPTLAQFYEVRDDEQADD